MNIAHTIDDLTAHSGLSLQTASAPKHGHSFADWILLTGILSGVGALALACIANV